LVTYRGSEVLDATDILIDDLNAYEAITLYSLTIKTVGSYRILLTKSGGFWPLLLVKVSERFDITQSDIIRAVNSVKSKTKDKLTYLQPDAEFWVIADFLQSLLSDQYPKIGSVYEFMNQVVHEYHRTLEKLEKKKLIEDPFDVENYIVITRMLIEEKNKITEKGQEKINTINQQIHEPSPQSQSQSYHARMFMKDIIGSFQRLCTELAITTTP
jgi:hypothetical protein